MASGSYLWWNLVSSSLLVSGSLLISLMGEENQAIVVSSCPCGISQKLNQLAHSLVTSKPGLDSEPAISVLEKFKEQLIVISDFVKEIEVSAKAEKILSAAAAGEKTAHIQILKSGFRMESGEKQHIFRVL